MTTRIIPEYETNLRARLKLVDTIADEQGCSIYLVTLGCLFLACSDEAPEEPILEQLFHQQAESEVFQNVDASLAHTNRSIRLIDPSEVLDAISSATHNNSEPS